MVGIYRTPINARVYEPVYEPHGAMDMNRQRPARRRITLADVARVAGVSPATVSRALAADPQISGRTQERVRRAADQLGYVPNAAARSLALQHTAILALLIPDLSDPVYGQVTAGFEQVATAHGMHVVLATTQNEIDQEWRTLKAVMTHRPSGIAMLGSVLDQDEVLRALGPTPCVFVHSENLALAGHKRDVPYGGIRTDEPAGIRQVAHHLAERGYRKTAYVTGPDLASNIIRREALLESAALIGLSTTIIDAPREHWQAVDGLARQIVRAGVDSVVCYDDRLALAVMSALRDLNVSIPEDVGIVGFDDIPFAALANPRLTTVAQPSADIGRTGAEMLLDALDSGDMPPSRVVDVQLVVRDSTPVRVP